MCFKSRISRLRFRLKTSTKRNRRYRLLSLFKYIGRYLPKRYYDILADLLFFSKKNLGPSQPMIKKLTESFSLLSNSSNISKPFLPCYFSKLCFKIDRPLQKNKIKIKLRFRLPTARACFQLSTARFRF